MISATSTSSKLKSDIFFRTVAPTTEAAKVYTKYINDQPNTDKLIIFYDPNSIYSTSLMNDLVNNLGFKTLKKVCLDESNTGIEKCPYSLKVNLEKEITQAINEKYQWGILIPSVQTGSIATAIARINSQQPQKLNLFQEADLADYIEGVTLAGSCLNKESKYVKNFKEKWQPDITATTTDSYDATQAFIAAINRSSKNPTRKDILDQLKTLKLPNDPNDTTTSGFGLEWSKENPLDHFNIKQKYCIYKIENNKFKEFPEK